jgi:hypothetical protein
MSARVAIDVARHAPMTRGLGPRGFDLGVIADARLIGLFAFKARHGGDRECDHDAIDADDDREETEQG